jgi:hypothetical protein
VAQDDAMSEVTVRAQGTAEDAGAAIQSAAREGAVMKRKNPMAESDPMASARCTARSKQRGTQCKQRAIPGGTVCRFHGGAAPQVIRSARERIAAAADPAIDVLLTALKSKDEKLRAQVAQDLLDRAGHGAKQKHEVGFGLSDPFAAVDAAVHEANRK